MCPRISFPICFSISSSWIILPRKNHKESRILFVREAKKVQQKEFLRWYKLTANLKGVLKLFRNKDLGIPTLYLMGEEDHLFLAAVRDTVFTHASAQLVVFPNVAMWSMCSSPCDSTARVCDSSRRCNKKAPLVQGSLGVMTINR